MKRMFWVLIPSLIWSIGHFTSLSAGTQVKTQAGIVEGVMGENGLIVFRGVSFAAPPVGELRWKEPQPVPSWEGVRRCDDFGDDPMQPHLFGDIQLKARRQSEDCLYLNIWSPREAHDCPVLIYFNGGGLMCGSGSEPRYAGDSLAAHGIISITANYREGIFGYLAHPELTAESPHHTSGNYGALDQVAAIRWVYDNIAAFGGDPKKITIVGESAGSFSVSALMASPLCRDLLWAAIGSSGAELKPSSAIPLEESEKMGRLLLESKGVTSIAELRSLSADSLQLLMPPMGMPKLSVDGYFLPMTVDRIFTCKEQAMVPLLVGWNSMESHPLQILQGEMPTFLNLVKALTPRFGTRTLEVLEAFEIRHDSDVMGWRAIELSGALFTAFPTWKWAELHKRTGQPVYRYRFNHARPPMVGSGEVVPKNTIHGAVHSADIEYAMGTLATNKVYAWRAEDHQVSNTFMHYYINFIKTRNPNGEGLPFWHPITGEEVAPVMQIDVYCIEKRYATLEKAYRVLDDVLK